MDDMGWPPDLPEDSGTEQWRDAAAEIKCRYQQVRQDFDSDASFQAYLKRVAQLGTLPPFPMRHWVEEESSAKMEALKQLIDTYPLDPNVFQDNDSIYRLSMVHFCSQLLKARVAFKTGLTEKAWWHLSHLCFYDGQAQRYYLRVKPAEDKRQSGKKGGIAKEANKQQAARNACIQHLKNDCPPGGWVSPNHAIDTVAPKVTEMIRKQREEVDVRQLLYAWLNGDEEVQQAAGFKVQCTKK